MVHRWKTRGAALMMAVALVSGCSNLYRVDLTADRQRNWAEDHDILSRSIPVLTEDLLLPRDAVQTGLSNNLDLRISRVLIDIADDAARSEKLRMLPNLNLTGDVSYRDKYPLREYENLETGAIQLSNTVSEERFRKSASAVLTWNLLDFGLSFLRSRQAAHQSEIRRIEQERQAQTLALDIMIAYRQTAMAEANLEYISEMAEVMEQFKAGADAMVNERRLDPIVAREIERELASLAVTAGDLQAEVSGARITLCRLMGVSPTSRFELSPGEALFSGLESLPVPEQLDPRLLEAAAMHRRPELFTADLQQRIQQDEARAALVNMFPGIRLEGAYTYDDNRYLINNHWSTVGAGLVTNLLALPSKWYEFSARKKGVEHARFQRLLLTASVIAQVHLALHEFGVRKEQFRLYDEAYEVYDDLLRMTRERNDAGVAGFPDTLVTQRMMEAVVARIQKSRQMAALLNARDTLAVTLGLGYEEWDAGLTTAQEPMPDHPVSGGGGPPEQGKDLRREDSPMTGLNYFLGDFYPGGAMAQS